MTLSRTGRVTYHQNLRALLQLDPGVSALLRADTDRARDDLRSMST